MIVKCERCQWQGEAQPKPYPSAEAQTKHYNCDGDKVIDCPRCNRGYFYESDYNGFGDRMENPGQWVSDRPLTIIRE